MSPKILHRCSPPSPQADDWGDGPHFRPFFADDFVHHVWAPDHSLSIDALETEGCWVYTVSGFGAYRCGGQRKILGPGQVFAYRSPDRGRLHLERSGLPWHIITIHVTGGPALAMFDYIVNRFGAFHELPRDCAAVKYARKLSRLSAERTIHNAHFWSRHTFAFLDAWWECADKLAGPMSLIAHEAPHTSRLIGLKATNIKSLADQLGFSRSHLSRKLKAQWDKPPGAALRHVRMEEAAKLLRAGDLAIGDIAIQLGFSTTSALTRAFKKAFGIGPLAYRIQQGKGRPGSKRSARIDAAN